MFRKSKLITAKQKISELKEKYFNSSNLIKDDDIRPIDLPPNSDLLENNKSGKENSIFNVLNDKTSPVLEVKSPRYEITNLFNDAKHNKVTKISSETFESNHNLGVIEDHHTASPFSNTHSPSELSHCSKTTNKTLKTESLVLSDLSNQFEHICFLSSSSDEENATEVHPAVLSFPRTGRKLSGLGLLQTSFTNFDGNSEGNENNDVQKREVSSSELSDVKSEVNSSSDLSDVQSDVNCTVFSNNEDSVKISAHPVRFEANNAEEGGFKKKETCKGSENSFKSSSDEKQISFSSPNFECNSSSKPQDFTESSEKLNVISPLKEINPSQLSTNIPTKPKCRNSKPNKPNHESNVKLGTESNNFENSESVFQDGEVTYKRYVDKSRPSVSDDNIPVHKEVPSQAKKSRGKYPKRSKTVLRHSTNLKPSRNRPILKSCVLIGKDESNEEYNVLSTQRMFASKLDGCGYEEVITQLLRHQVQLTRHFIHSHHQMYLTCCQAVKILSEEHNNCHIH